MKFPHYMSQYKEKQSKRLLWAVLNYCGIESVLTGVSDYLNESLDKFNSSEQERLNAFSAYQTIFYQANHTNLQERKQ